MPRARSAPDRGANPPTAATLAPGRRRAAVAAVAAANAAGAVQMLQAATGRNRRATANRSAAASARPRGRPAAVGGAGGRTEHSGGARPSPPRSTAASAAQPSISEDAAGAARLIRSADLQDLLRDMVRAGVAEVIPARPPSTPPPVVSTPAAPAPSALPPAQHATGTIALPTMPAVHDFPAAPLPLVSPSVPGSLETDPALALRAAVPSAIAALIVGHGYVDLSLLDESSAGEGAGHTFSLVDGQLKPTAVPRRRLQHVGAWCTAFLRYAAVYLAAHPADAAGLIGHMQQVASLQSPGMGFAWRDFDEAFRRARALQPAAHHWGATAASSPLWLNAVARGMSGARAGPSGPSRGAGSAMAGRSGNAAPPFHVCLAYNSAGGCSRVPCRYNHTCRACRGSHALPACPRRHLTV